MGEAVSGFFAGTGLIDVVILVTFIEWAALVFWRRFTGRGMSSTNIRIMLFPGIWLMFAFRSVITETHGLITAGFLLAAGLAHFADVLRRWHAPET